MARVEFPEHLPLTEVERPSRHRQETVPAALLEAIAATVKSGRAVKVDGTQWEANVRNAIYRRVLGLNRDEHLGFTVHGRRDDGLMYFWAVSRRGQRRKARKARARA